MDGVVLTQQLVHTIISAVQLQVDLKGACGDKSWARPFADALGWTDAFLDRILMTVILIRDEVEHSRFSLKPLSLLNSTVLDEAAGLQGGSRVSEPVGESVQADVSAAGGGVEAQDRLSSLLSDYVNKFLNNIWTCVSLLLCDG